MGTVELEKLLLEDKEDEVIGHGAPVHQDKVFLIMWQSSKSGGTYTALRKSIRGRNRFLSGMRRIGMDMSNVQVFEQTKTWVPTPKAKKGINNG